MDRGTKGEVMNNRRKNKADMTISEQFESIKERMCDKYCKWPDKWDEEAEGIPLFESEHCAHCPLMEL